MIHRSASGASESGGKYGCGYVIEQAFSKACRRTCVVGRSPTGKSALVLVRAPIEQDRLSWRGVAMTPSVLQGAVQAVEGPKAEAVRIGSARRCPAAA